LNYADRPSEFPTRIQPSLGKIFGALGFALIGLFVAWSVPARSAEYLVFNPVATDRSVDQAALKGLNDRVGCELAGKPVQHEGKAALRFRFPAIDPASDASFVDCIRRAMPPGYTMQKASWLTAKRHEWLP